MLVRAGGSAVTMKTTLPVLVLGFLASALTARPVAAATASASISVSATVQVSCLVSAATSTFRIYASAPAASAASVACSNSAPYTVTLIATSAHGAVRDLRETTDSGVILQRYALSSKSRASANWGQALSTRTVAVFGGGFVQELAIHGRLSATQGAMPGLNPDTMIVVVTY